MSERVRLSPQQWLRTMGTMLAGLIRDGWKLLISLPVRGWRFAESWLLDSKKARYGIAVSRIVFGVTGLGLLLTNFRTRLYSFGSGSVWNDEVANIKSDFPKIWIFSSFHNAITNDVAYTALYVLLMLLAVLVILGWRIKIVLPVYFVLWVSFIEANDMIGDQGDNMYRIALFFFLFADTAGRWSLDARRRRKNGTQRILPREVSNLFHNLVLVILTAQVSFVYVSGALYKAGGTPWSSGYAIYNPLSTERFGTWPFLTELITTWAPLVAFLTVGSMIMQMCFPLMLLTRPTRIIALIAIMSFHIGIGVTMGLPWFSLTMIAIDFIFIRDRTWKGLIDRIHGGYREARLEATGPGGGAEDDSTAATSVAQPGPVTAAGKAKKTKQTAPARTGDEEGEETPVTKEERELVPTPSVASRPRTRAAGSTRKRGVAPAS
ncbi:HTTM domain-containing protein [Mycetocola tolaasinivorans]|uniref:HTTM domain-containing protein n=1 Tax=Mycetocola tolaasinivorans TaxID=76635 RepID=A0A3L7A1E7_9MICO|nr:HTTM domain-containing protein [Mycetocola tolaasinivorans]RLP74106.1 HTTM domain-containing protein [Mycetocola tolaasinivorans]